MSQTASLVSAYKHHQREAEKEKNARDNELGKSNISADTPFENLHHMEHFFRKRSPARILMSENIRSPIHSVLTIREKLLMPQSAFSLRTSIFCAEKRQASTVFFLLLLLFFIIFKGCILYFVFSVPLISHHILGIDTSSES